MARLTLVIHALNSGGAERVLAVLANHWADSGASVTVITLADSGSDRYRLRDAVGRVGLGLLQPSGSPWQALRNNVRRLRRLRGAIRDSDPDVVISFTDSMNVLTLLAGRGGVWPVVIAERNDPRRQRMSRTWEFLRRWSYPRCTAAVVQTATVAQHVQRLVRAKPVFVIPNAVVSAPPRVITPAPPSASHGGEASSVQTGPAEAGTVNQRSPYVAAMGRLSHQKGFDLLIEAFARLAPKYPGWELRIIGEGADRAALERLATERGVALRVRFCGWLNDPQQVLAGSELFALSSRWEGFPNALLEAMACGVPAVSFDCDSGPAEIIRNRVDGLLVPPDDVSALATALDHLMDDAAGRREMGDRAREVVTRFSCARFFAQWDNVVRAAIGES